MKSLLGLIAAALLTTFSYQGLRSQSMALSAEENLADEALYLPSGQALEVVSLGYKNLLSDLLWFKTISYFGKHVQSDKNYRWFAHMCDLVTQLDPKVPQVYEFCATMLAWEANQPEESVKLLTRAIEHNPDQWMYPYLRGFSYMYFLGDDEKASLDLASASKLPGAPPSIARLAAKKMANASDPLAAREFLIEMIKTSKDPSQRKVLQNRLQEIQYEIDLVNLEKAMAIYKERTGLAPKDLADLVQAGILSKLGLDPFGGKYYLDPEAGEVKSTSNRKRLSETVSKRAMQPK